MENSINNQVRLHQNLQRFNVRNNTVLNPIPGYGNEVTAHNANMVDLRKAIQETVKQSKGDTDDNDLRKLFMAQTTINAALLCKPYARNLGNKTLLGLIDSQLTPILKATPPVAIGICSQIRDAINANLPTFPNVDANTVTSITNSITAYADNYNKPKETISLRKSLGTEKILLVLEKLDLNLQNMSDFVHGTFANSNRDIIDEFETITTIHDLGLHYTGFIFEVFDANPPADALTDQLQNAVISIDEFPKKAVITNIKGIAHIKSVKNGTYHLTITCPGFKTVKKIIEFKKGKTPTIQIKMEKL